MTFYARCAQARHDYVDSLKLSHKQHQQQQMQRAHSTSAPASPRGSGAVPPQQQQQAGGHSVREEEGHLRLEVFARWVGASLAACPVGTVAVGSECHAAGSRKAAWVSCQAGCHRYHERVPTMTMKSVRLRIYGMLIQY